MGMTMGEYLEQIRNGEIRPPTAGGDPDLELEVQKASRPRGRRAASPAAPAKKAAKRTAKRAYKRKAKATKAVTPADLSTAAARAAATTSEA